MKAFLFDYRGRLNRGAFWKAHFILFGLWIAIGAVCGLLALLIPSKTDTTVGLVLTVTLLVAIFGLVIGGTVGMIWSGVCLGIRRYHDRDKPGIWVCIQFVPAIGGLWYFIEAFCLDGTHGPNLHGPDPLGRAPYPVDVPSGGMMPLGATPAAGAQAPPTYQAPRAYVARPPSGRPGWVLPVMFALLVPPALALAAGLVMTARAAMWLNGAVHVDGTVTALKPGSKTESGHMRYYPVVEATTGDGTPIKITDGWESYPPAEIGSTMEVAFPPGRPEAAMVVAFANLWLWPLILDLFGIVVVGWLVVIVIVKLTWKRAPRAAPPSPLATFA